MSRTKSKGTTAPTPLLDSAAPMPESVARIIDVFREDLADVTFPGVSVETLECAAELVRGRAADLELLRSQISAAEAELATARHALGDLAERGLAYAKVYASGNAVLTQTLSQFGVSETLKHRRRKLSKTEEEARAETCDLVEAVESSASELLAGPRNARRNRLGQIGTAKLVSDDQGVLEQVQVASAG